MTLLGSLLLLTLNAAACLSDPGIGAAQSDIGVMLNRPPDAVDCIAFTVANADGTSQTYAFAFARSLMIPNVSIGAYNLSAVAFKSGLPAPVTDAQCTSALASSSAAWTTESPVAVTVTRTANTPVSITLVRAGTITIRAGFFEAPEVVAQGEGTPQFLAAAWPSVAWADQAPNGQSSVVRLVDGSGLAPVRTSGLVNVGMIAIDASSGAFYWEDGRSGTTDKSGHLLNDGAMFSAIPGLGPVTGLNPADLAFASSLGQLYWGEQSTDSINCLGCPAPLAENELGPNTMTAHLNRIYWGSNGGTNDLVREMVVGRDAAPRTIATVTPRVPFAMTADDDFVYWMDYDGITNDFDDARIVSEPWDGGPQTVLVDHIPLAFPLVVFKGNVFYLDPLGVHSVSSAGDPPVDVVTSSTVGGFAPTTDGNGHDVVYWTDTSHGGLVWRGRLN